MNTYLVRFTQTISEAEIRHGSMVIKANDAVEAFKKVKDEFRGRVGGEIVLDDIKKID
jgi:hypothetical protein